VWLPLRRPAVFSLAFLICGIIFGAEKIFFVAAVFVCVFLYRACRYWQVIFFAFFFLFGAWRVEKSLHSDTLAPRRIVFSGVVLDTGYTSGGNQRAVIRGTHAETDAKIKIMAYIRPHQKHLSLGQEVTLVGEITPLSRPENPVGYNQFQHLRSQKIDATIFPEEIETGGVRRSFGVILRGFRDRLSDVYDGILPPREAAVIKSMILGDRFGLDADLADLYRVMGIFHILSISGLHITIIMLAANKFLSLAVNPRRASLFVLCAMILYCLMTGAAVATVRAVMMGGVLVGAKLFHREYDLISSVAWACVFLLLYEPLYLYNVGFQLSFGAVFGIGVLTAPIEKLLRANEKKSDEGNPSQKIKIPLSNFRKNLAVGIAAVVSTNIVFAHHFYEIPLYAVFGNLVIMPTVGIILVLGLAVGLGGLVFFPAAYFFSGTIFFILKFYEAAAVFFSSLPFAMVITGGGSVFVSALAVVALACFAFPRGLKIFFASILILIAAIFWGAYPQTLQITEFENYTVLRKRSQTLVIGAAAGGEDLLLQYFKKRGKNRAEFFFTQPPRPQDAHRLAKIIPRARAVYLPAHVDGVTQVLMQRALDEFLPREIIFLNDGDTRVIGATEIIFRALPLGGFQFEIKGRDNLKKNNEVSKHCRKTKKPILITKNGSVEKIILNTETYEKLL
jgi:ComEC/Rec2-related protein